jgi:hypothetical protein
MKNGAISYKPGMPGFDEIAAQTTHISKIKSPYPAPMSTPTAEMQSSPHSRRNESPTKVWGK